jgi:hypothetical protein
MRFAHQDPEFGDLVRIVARENGLSAGLIEKDYWVTHTLWALQQTGLEIWFKGGTSLSKGFGLVRRFSEDIDLRIEPGAVVNLPKVASWKSENRGRIAERRAWYEALEEAMPVPGAKVRLDPAQMDLKARSAGYRVEYPGLFLRDLGPSLKPFVLLEVGIARVTPFAERDLDSFVHQWLARSGRSAEFTDNRPRKVRTVHPLVTLIEKLDAVSRRVAGGAAEPASFVRHYEDAARIIERECALPPVEQTASQLVAEMLRERQIAHAPRADDPAFLLEDPGLRARCVAAHAAIGATYWGDRESLDDCCKRIRDWIAVVPSASVR